MEKATLQQPRKTKGGHANGVPNLLESKIRSRVWLNKQFTKCENNFDNWLKEEIQVIYKRLVHTDTNGIQMWMKLKWCFPNQIQNMFEVGLTEKHFSLKIHQKIIEKQLFFTINTIF